MQGYRAGGFIAVQQGDNGAGAVNTLPGQENTGGATQPAQELLDVIADQRRLGIANKVEPSQSGHSATARLRILYSI